MDRNQFTVLFQAPFWVGIAERWDGEGYQAARVVFGPQPTDAQVYEWLLREWHRLRFSPAVLGKTLPQGRKNPKRALPAAGAGGTSPPVQGPPEAAGGAGAEVPPAAGEKARKEAGQMTIICPA